MINWMESQTEMRVTRTWFTVCARLWFVAFVLIGVGCGQSLAKDSDNEKKPLGFGIRADMVAVGEALQRGKLDSDITGLQSDIIERLIQFEATMRNRISNQENEQDADTGGNTARENQTSQSAETESETNSASESSARSAQDQQATEKEGDDDANAQHRDVSQSPPSELPTDMTRDGGDPAEISGKGRIGGVPSRQSIEWEAGVWGTLPNKLRQRIRQTSLARFSPEHRRAIELYYRALSEMEWDSEDEGRKSGTQDQGER